MFFVGNVLIFRQQLINEIHLTIKQTKVKNPASLVVTVIRHDWSLPRAELDVLLKIFAEDGNSAAFRMQVVGKIKRRRRS